MAVLSPFRIAKRCEMQIFPFQIKDFLKSLGVVKFSKNKKKKNQNKYLSTMVVAHYIAVKYDYSVCGLRVSNF